MTDEFHYRTWIVSEEVFDQTPIGAEYQGGIVIDGIHDQLFVDPRWSAVPILTTRHEGPCVDWEEKYRQLRAAIIRPEARVVVNRAQLVQDVAGIPKAMQLAQEKALSTLVNGLIQYGAIMPRKLEAPDGTVVSVDVHILDPKALPLLNEPEAANDANCPGT